MSSHNLDLVLIDDEPRVVAALSREIGLSFPGDSFHIHSFTEVEKCLTYVEDHAESTFLVISDLRMPDMKGSEVLERIREVSPDIQTILLTAYLDIDDIQKAVSTTLQTLLFKPWKKETLEAEVHKALETWNLRRENVRLKEERDQLLETAGEFQHALFSSTVPDIKDLDFDAVYSPRSGIHCGGDFYRVIEERSGRYVIILGDVTGHGPRAALVTTMINTLLMGLELEHNPILASPAKILEFLNFRMCSLLEHAPDMFASLSAVCIDQEARSCDIAIAGQPPLYMYNRGEVRIFGSTNPVLGFSDGIRYNEMHVDLSPQEHLYLFTDGLIESVPSRVRLTDEQIKTCIEKNHGADTRVLRDRFKDFLPGKAFFDDVTLIQVRIP
ncbi:MAG TPA: SpoIIE family protein phosphatase [Spirochaetota bacterium]|nr:SpoIIE family protein phosphatase [Spirochaetota bacterium]HPJ37266.1 SpoIIE family protein phosphatase [Spirochaetota bacterium]